MIENEYLMLVIGMGLVTFLPRWIPLFFLTKQNLPDVIVEWLDLIPAAILSALLLPALITTGDPRHLAIFQPELLVAIPTFIFALKTKSLGGTVVVGMSLFWLAGRMI
ncbi:AzlD domain-containing protein [Desulfonema magnum]|uniref:Branched-chain amino acid transport protein domain-containing protein n=1 Tax=Desulfonema magnum TaxID=45655 RepID=A0A975BVC1_9BACT|nr:AzlD domain-containing protein [Desulfonema magnum]QTA92032.1 Branched-chain amino acid transport protein domain-containing protein [Desulfonema magnum]